MLPLNHKENEIYQTTSANRQIKRLYVITQPTPQHFFLGLLERRRGGVGRINQTHT